MTFREAVEAAPAPVNAAFQPGLQALGKYSERIQGNPRAFSGSIALDFALERLRPHDCRWDYGIGVRQGNGEKAFWVEVHHASTHGVTDVLKKLKWLKQYLNHEAPNLREITRSGKPYVWIASGGVHIPKDTRQHRQLAQSGLHGPVKQYVLA